MNNKTSLLAGIAMIFLALNSQAQTKTGSVSGNVTDASNVAVNAATVSLLKAKDSSLVKMAAADKTGKFTIENVANGKYLLLVSAVGYNKTYSQALEINGNAIAATPIALEPASKNLKEVTVTASKPMVEMKIDRTVVNVDAAVTNTGSTALEVLEKSPGVQVDKDGNISLKGKQGVTIMLDGRPSYLTGEQLANMLRGMQASQLEQIEIMTNPPAKYDAAGNSGIINIKTKKNKIRGFNGNVSAGVGQGAYFKNNESISINYRNNKINLFSSYSFSRNIGYQMLDIHRRYINDDGTTNAIFDQNTFMKTYRTNNNLKVGMDYYLSSKTTLGVVVSGFYNPQKTNVKNTSYLKSPQDVVDSIVYATSYNKETWKNASVNLNMRHQFDSTGRELTADLDYLLYDAYTTQNFTNTNYTPSWTKKNDEILFADLPVSIKIYTARVDYTHPLKNNAKLEVGWKSSYVSTNNKANFFNYESNDWTPDYNRTNFFNYKENINAAYVNLNKQINKKWGVQAGLRFENTNYKGLQYGNPTRTDSSFKRSYSSLFPTIYVSYALNDNNQFGVSYGRRIDRPDYEDLNPFQQFLDKYTYQVGNPFLRPQYSNNIELSHIYKGFLSTTLNYSKTTDLTNETFDQDGYATIVRKGNIGRRENAGIAVSVQYPVAKWYTTMIYVNYNYTKYAGKLYGDDINVSAANLTVNMNNQFKFNKGWSAELSGWYRTKGVEGQILIRPMGQLSAGIAKQVLKGKGSVKMNVRDIFFTQVVKGSMNFKATEATFENRRDNRVANITFTYRFGKPLKNTPQRNRNGASDEQNRVKSGN
ncbi:MAG: outer membrane beta-barrel family protein [Chitinophagaceae bacterium]